MFLVNQAMVDLNVGTAGLVAVLGYAVVFVGLIALMAVIILVGKIMVAKKSKAAAPVAAAPPRPSPFWPLPHPARLAKSSSLTWPIRRPRCSWRSSPTSSANP